MDYREWTTRFREMAAALRAQHVDVDTLTIGPPVSEDELRSLELYTANTNGLPSFRFDPSLRGLQRAASNIELRWRWVPTPGRPPLSGQMNLMPISLLYDSEAGGEPWHDVWRNFDEVGAVTQVVVRFDGRTREPSLAWRSTEGGSESITPLSITIDEYLELAIAACCLGYWPLLFASAPDVLSPDHERQLFADLRALEPAANADVLERSARAHRAGPDSIRGRSGLP